MKAEMGSNSRGGLHPSRHASRTPPFLLVGLLVVIAVLTFNYWTTSVTNQELEQKLERVNKHYSELNKRYSELNQRFLKQNSQLFSKNQENLSSRDQVFQLEKREKELAQQVQERELKLEDLQAEFQRLKSDLDATELKLSEANQQVDECNVSVDECSELRKNADDAVIQCQQNEGKLDMQVQALQQQLSNANNAPQPSCDSQVAASRVSLLNTLQNFGGPQVLLSLQKVGVDISGVELRSDWRPPQSNQAMPVENAQAQAQPMQPQYNEQLAQALPQAESANQAQPEAGVQYGNSLNEQQQAGANEARAAVEGGQLEGGELPQEAADEGMAPVGGDVQADDEMLADDEEEENEDDFQAAPLNEAEASANRGELEAAAASVGERLPPLDSVMPIDRGGVVAGELQGEAAADDEPADDVFDPVARADDDEDLVPEDVADDDEAIEDLNDQADDEEDEDLNADPQYAEQDPRNLDEGIGANDELVDDDQDDDDLEDDLVNPMDDQNPVVDQENQYN